MSLCGKVLSLSIIISVLRSLNGDCDLLNPNAPEVNAERRYV